MLLWICVYIRIWDEQKTEENRKKDTAFFEWVTAGKWLMVEDVKWQQLL